MRVMFTSVGAWGHIHPMVPLAQAFLARGDAIVWATSSDACVRLEGDGIPATPAGLTEAEFTPHERDIVARYAHLPPEERRLHVFGKIFGELSASASIDAIEAAAGSFAPDLIVSEQGEFCGPLIAARRGIPHACHAYGPRLPPAPLRHVETEVASLWRSRGLAPQPLGGCYDHLYLDIYPPSLADDRTDLPCPVQSVRPAGFATAGEELPELVFAGVDPLVYLTLGTVFNSRRVLARAIEAVRDLPVRLVVTVGPHGDPDGFGAQPAHVHVSRYISQNDLMPHCAAVISHAGSGTFLAAIAHGIPQVCLPQGADQFLNASSGAAAGAAIALDPDDATVDAIRDAALRVLSEARFREAAGEVAADIERMPSADEVAGILVQRFG